MSISKGQSEELAYSRKIHSEAMPLLVSPLILRESGAGQVDLAILKKTSQWEVIVYEIKSSGHISFLQYKRLKKSAHYLAMIFDCSARIQVIGPNDLSIAKDKKLN